MHLRTINDSVESLIWGNAVVFNTESLYWYKKSQEYKAYVDGCDNFFIDGIGVAIRLFGLEGAGKRFNGPDLVDKILDHREHDLRIILVGGASIEKELLEQNRIEHQVELSFSSNLDNLVEEALQQLACFDLTDVLIFVSLGLPKQEIFCLRLLHQLRALGCQHFSLIPVGAAIDFRFGMKARSHVVFRRCGLEWLPRLVREPRMIPRIIRSVRGIFFGKNSHPKIK